MEKYYTSKQEELRKKSIELKMNLPSRGEVEPLTKRLKTEETFFSRIRDNPDIIKVQVRLGRNAYQPQTYPKSILLAYVNRHQLKGPVYHTEQVDKLFYSTVTVDGKQYAADYL